MAFQSTNFNLLMGTLGGGPLRIWAYMTDDEYDVVTGMGYFRRAFRSGVVIGDIILVRPSDGGGSYELRVLSSEATGVEVIGAIEDGYVRTSWFGDGFTGLKRAWTVSKRVRCTPGVDYVVPLGEHLTSEGEDVHLDAPQSRFLLTEPDAQLCQLRGGWEAEQPVSAINGLVLTVENGSVYARGDILKIISNEPLPEFVLYGRKGEFVEVSAVAGNDVTLIKPLYYTYDLGENCRVSRIRKAVNIKVDVGEVVFPINADSTRNAIQVYGAHDPLVTVERAPILSAFIVRFVSTIGGEINMGAIGTATAPDGGGPNGYGVELHNCEYARVRVRYAGGGTRHVVDHGGGTGGDGTTDHEFEQCGASAYNKVYNSLAVGTSASPFQCHHGARQLTYEDCYTIGCFGDYFTRGVGTVFRRCVSYFPQTIAFATAEQFEASECDTDDTLFEDCRVIGGGDRIFQLRAGAATISGGEFEVKAGATASNMIACEVEQTALTMRGRPRFIVNGTASNRVISINAAGFSLIDLGDAYFKLTQANNPSYLIEAGGGETPVVRWNGLTVDGLVDAFSGIFGDSLPAAGSSFGDAQIAPGFVSICATQTLASVEGYITGLLRDGALRREYRPQVNSLSLGTVTTGTLTFGPSVRLVHYTNNGAHTLAPPSTDCDVEVLISNGSSAGAITTSGWSHVRGDSFTTTNTHRFLCRARRVGASVSILIVTALQ